MNPLPESTRQEIDRALFEGRKIEAIQAYRLAADCGLKDAKQAVERREAELRAQDPARFPRPRAGCLPLLIASGAVLGLLAAW